MKREQEFIKNSAILFFGTVFPRFISVIMLPVITGYLTKEEYGIYDLLITLTSLFLPIATLQMQASAFRFLIKERENHTGQKLIVSNIVLFTVPVCLAALTTLYFCMRNIDSTIKFLIINYYFTDTMLIMARQIIRGLGKNKIYSVSVLMNSVIELVLVLIFLVQIGLGLNGVLYALTISQGISLLYIIIRVNISSYIDIRLIALKEIKSLIDYSWPLIPNALSSWVVRVSDRLVLSLFIGIEATAVYAVANKLPSIFSVVQSTFSLAWQENASETVNDKDSGDYYGKMFDRIYNIMVGIMALLIAFTPFLFKILIKGDYDEAYNHMSILYIGVLFSTICSYLGGIYIAHMKSKEIGITTTIAALINLTVNLCFIKIIGVYAASISTAVCYIWLCIYRMRTIQKIQKINFNYKRIIELFIILCILSFIYMQRILWMDCINILFSIFLFVGLNYELLKILLKTVIKKRKQNETKY